MKKIWTYKYGKGLKEQLISQDYIDDGKYIYVSFCWGVCDWNSVILKVDKETGEADKLFEEKHVIRHIGCTENHNIYFASMRGFAFCIDMDGNHIWETDLGHGNPTFEVLIDGTRVYTNNNCLYCLDKKDGTILWKNEKEFGRHFALDEQYLYTAERGGKVYCLDKYTGKKIWSYGKEEWISGCYIYDEECLLLTHCHGKILFINRKSGKLVREIETKGKLYQEPLFMDGKIFAGAGDHVIDTESKCGYMTCYDINEKYKMKEVFTFEVDSNVSSKAVVHDNKIYFGTVKGYLYCIDSQTGEEAGKKIKTAGPCRNVHIENNKMYVMSDKGQLVCYEL